MYPSLFSFSRASLIFDVLILGMLLINPIVWFSISCIKQKKIQLHKKIQTFITILLSIVIVLFEIDIRMNGWTHFAKASPYYDSYLFPILYFHLTIAIITTFSWYAAFYFGLKHQNQGLNGKHRALGKLSVLGLLLTTLTGQLFYYMAFVAI